MRSTASEASINASGKSILKYVRAVAREPENFFLVFVTTYIINIMGFEVSFCKLKRWKLLTDDVMRPGQSRRALQFYSLLNEEGMKRQVKPAGTRCKLKIDPREGVFMHN